MILSTINVGTLPNDGTGDPDRTAFQKINANFSAIAGAFVTGTFTLNASATSTTVSVPGASASSSPLWVPRTADAASAFPLLYGTCGTNVLNLTHASNPNVDQTFTYFVEL